ncbi:hypothetical protein [Caproiciproducens faecalis]|uniref:DNA-binding protein n=1 Tax=Caproiciproducens faecalis TaxID=2820301 RepID=A0ABS7DRB9_9FIRM|nr:hypothetical protein [Caproiciproducens faecalis]MBW7573853.1 hypothetical protein [Caproiciproducens faecalis]
MRKILQTLILCLILVIPFSVQVRAADAVSINSLIENAKAMDGKEVSVQGEAIGEMLERGEYCWVNLNDGTNAIGIWMKTADARSITRYGDYKNTGDTVKITGVFYRACAQHGGEADIHGTSLQIVKKGVSSVYPVSSGKLLTAVLLTVLAGCLFTVYYRISRKPRPVP